MKKIIRSCTVSMSICFVREMLPDLVKRYEVVIVSSPGEELNEVATLEGVSTVALPMQRHISPLKDFVSLWRMIRLMRRERPAIVHSMTPKAGLITMVAAWLCRVPVRIHTFTGLVFPTSHGLKRRLLMLTDSITCRCATHIIPEGQGVRSDLLDNNITAKPLKVLGYGNVMGVDTKRFSLRNEVVEHANRLRDDNLFTFLFVGRIVGDKGINELVEAFTRLNKSYPDTRLMLVGFFEEHLDPVSPLTRRLITEHDKIEYAGVKTGDELIAYYAAADCFVFPSYREGFPNTVLEAGSMSLPQVVTDINGSREIIEDGKNGLIVPSHDTSSLQEAMQRMLTDRDMYAQMKLCAREMITSRFDQHYVRQCLYDYYDEIIK